MVRTRHTVASHVLRYKVAIVRNKVSIMMNNVLMMNFMMNKIVRNKVTFYYY